nr:PREDICTED: facilitated trehalose transporter Tret1-like isoform X2 [Bemisia tabaci]
MMAFVFNGVTEGQSAVLLPQLKEKESLIHITPEEETWIASLGILLSPVSALLIGPITDAFGRKLGLLFIHIFMGLGFAVIACATQVWHIYLGRCICSFALGLEVVSVVYMTETCAKRQRSFLLSTISPAFTLGVVVAYVIGGYLPWNIASAIFALSSFVYFVVQLLAPESPAWLFKRGRIDAAAWSLRKLGRSPSGIDHELQLLKLASSEESESFHLGIFLDPTVWKPFLILSLFHLVQCATGIYHIVYYTLDFVTRLGTTYDPLTVSIVISVVRVISNCTIGMYFTSYVSRRFSTILSALLMTVSSGAAGVYEFVFRDAPASERPYQWLPIILLVAYIVFGIIGVTTLPWMMSGEVFPLRVRGAMSGAVFGVGAGSMFVFIKIYEDCLALLNIWGLLFGFAIASFLTALLGIFLLPETLNKTLYEIEQGFMPKEKRSNGEESTLPAEAVS